MKIAFFLSLLISCSFVGAMDQLKRNNGVLVTQKREEPIKYRLAQKGEVLEGFKDIYVDSYKGIIVNKRSLTKKQLAENFEIMIHLVNKNENFRLVLLEHNKKPVGFLPFFIEPEWAILYDMSIAKKAEQSFSEAFFQIIDYLAIKKLYCVVKQKATSVHKIVDTLGCKEDEKIQNLLYQQELDGKEQALNTKKSTLDFREYKGYSNF